MKNEKLDRNSSLFNLHCSLSVLLAGVFALAAIDAWADDIKWIGGSGGSEAEPIDIYDSAKWNPNYLPSSSQVLWFENVTEPTVLTNCVENPAATAISGNAAINGGPFTFLGDYKWNGILYIKLNYNGAMSITKKGDWTVGNEMYLGNSGNAEPVSFTNETGNLQVGSSSAEHELHLGYGVGTSVTVEKNAGDWKLYGAMKVAEGSNSDVKFYHRGGNLVVANNLIVQTHGSGEFYMEGGHVTVSNMVRFGEWVLTSPAVANLYLNGGVFEAKLFRFHNAANWETYGYVVFNGGIYKAMANGSMVVTGDGCKKGAVKMLHFKVGERGGTIDTAGYDVVFPLQLLQDGDSTGGLCVKGGGSLTLENANVTYVGKTSVEAGTTLVVSDSTAKSNILSHGIELAGAPTPGTSYTVFRCNDDLTTDDLANVTCGVASEFTKVVGEDGKSIVVTVTTALKPGYWTGAKDNNLSDPGNWSDSEVPTSGNPTIYCPVATTLTVGDTFAPSSITFLEGSAAVTIDGDAISGIASITNLSSVSHTINVPVYFTGDIQVKQAAMAETGDLTKAHVTFAGGAYAASGCSLENGNYAANYSRCIFGKYYLDSTAEKPWTVPNQGGSKRVCVADGSYLYVPYAGALTELYVGTGAKVDVGDMSNVSGRISYKNKGEMVVSNLTVTGGDTFLTHNQGTTVSSVFKFGFVTNKIGTTHWLYLGDGNASSKQTIFFGEGGIGFEGSATTVICFGNKGTDNTQTTIRPWYSDFTIGGKTNSSSKAIVFDNAVVFNTDDEKEGKGRKITLDAITCARNSATITVSGKGTLQVNKEEVNDVQPAVTVSDSATLAFGEKGSLGTGDITLGAGTTLALTAASSRSEKLISNTLKLPTEGKAKLRIGGVRLRSDNHEIAALGTGTAENIELDENSEALAGRKASLRVDDKGSLILNIKPRGMVILLR